MCAHLEVGHLGVALLGASVVRQLNVPEAGQLVHQHRVLLDEGVEDVLWTDNKQAELPSLRRVDTHLPDARQRITGETQNFPPR